MSYSWNCGALKTCLFYGDNDEVRSFALLSFVVVVLVLVAFIFAKGSRACGMDGGRGIMAGVNWAARNAAACVTSSVLMAWDYVWETCNSSYLSTYNTLASLTLLLLSFLLLLACCYMAAIWLLDDYCVLLVRVVTATSSLFSFWCSCCCSLWLTWSWSLLAKLLLRFRPEPLSRRAWRSMDVSLATAAKSLRTSEKVTKSFGVGVNGMSG